jgi:hypothetical protein
MEQRYNKLIGRWETIYTKKVVETKEKSIKLVPNNRKELQELAKLHEIPANLSNDELKNRLNDILSQGE